MKVPQHLMITSIAFGLAASFSGLEAQGHSSKKGYCWGAASLGDGACGGKAPAGIEGDFKKSWPCGGNAPRAEWGWKKMNKEDCESSRFAEGNAEAFKAAGFETPQHTTKSTPNPLYAKPGYMEWLKSDLKKAKAKS